MYAKLGLANSILPCLDSTRDVFAVRYLLLRTYVLSIPFALEEAAQVDGAGWKMSSMYPADDATGC